MSGHVNPVSSPEGAARPITRPFANARLAEATRMITDARGVELQGLTDGTVSLYGGVQISKNNRIEVHREGRQEHFGNEARRPDAVTCPLQGLVGRFPVDRLPGRLLLLPARHQ
jgi:hypothetical protein